MALFDDFFGMFGGGGGASGYSGLTPDQSSLVNQQGWYPRADMVMPTGSTLEQPQGYSGLSPAQANSVNQLGYYNDAQLAQQPQSLWDKLTKALGEAKPEDMAKKAQEMLAGNKPPPLVPASALAAHAAGTMNPLHNIYSQLPLDPKQAYRRLVSGGMG